MIVEELVAKLGLEVDSSALSTLNGFLNQIQSGFAGLAAAAGAVGVGIAAAIGSAASAADNLGDQAAKLGVGVEALQELGFAATMSGSSAEAMAEGLKHLNRTLVDASQGSSEAAKALAGISTRDANGALKSADAVLGDLAEKFKNLPEGPERSALAMKIFGRSGAELVPLLAQGGAEIDKLRNRANELGLVFSGDAVKDAQAYDDALKELQGSLIGLRNTFATRFFKGVTEFFKRFTDLAIKLRPAVDEVSKGIQKFFGAIGEAASEVSDFFSSLDRMSGGLLTAFTTFMKNEGAINLVKAALLGLGVVGVASGLAVAASWIAAALPFIALAVLVGLVTDEIYTLIKGGDSLTHSIDLWFNSVDPTDNPLLVALKTIGALVLDITDPAKWDKFFKLFGMFSGAVNAVVPGLGLATGIAAGVGTAGRTSQGIEAALSPSAQSPQASAALSSQAQNFNAPVSVNAPITVNAAPGMSEEMVAKKVNEQLTSHIQAAAPAIKAK